MNTDLAPPTKEQTAQALDEALKVVTAAENSWKDTEGLVVDAILESYSAGHAVGYAEGYEAGSHEGARSAFDLAEIVAPGVCGVPGCGCDSSSTQPVVEDIEDELCPCGCDLPASIWDSLLDGAYEDEEYEGEQLVLNLDMDLAALEEDVEVFKDEVTLRLEAIELAVGLKYTGDQAD